MHLFQGDPLRDAIWQFVAFVVSTLLSILGLILPSLSTNKEGGERKRAYTTLIQPDSPLGCSSIGILFLGQLSAGYLLSLLLTRLFFFGQALDTTTLPVASFATVFITTITMTSLRHSRLALMLTLHFCAFSLLFGLTLVSLKMGAFLHSNLSFLRQFVVQYIPQVQTLPISLKAVPTDIRIYTPRTAKQLFSWGYGLSLAVVFFLYALSKRSLSQRASAWAYLDERSKKNILEDLDRQEKEASVTLTRLTAQEKQIDLEQKQLSATISVAGLLAESLYPLGTDPTLKAHFLQQVLPDLLQPGKKASPEIISSHLQQLADNSTPSAPPQPSPQPPLVQRKKRFIHAQSIQRKKHSTHTSSPSSKPTTPDTTTAPNLRSVPSSRNKHKRNAKHLLSSLSQHK